MEKCNNTALYESLEYCKGKPILPGIRPEVLACPKRDIVKWPVLPESAKTNMKELAVYQGSFTLAADKKWVKVGLTKNKGEVTSEAQGEDPSRTFVNKATFTHPETDEEATAFARQALYDDFVYIFRQRNGKYRVLGNEAFETVTSPGQKTGEGTTGESGTTFDVEVTDVCPAPFYVGTLETEEGTVDCSGTAED